MRWLRRQDQHEEPVAAAEPSGEPSTEPANEAETVAAAGTVVLVDSPDVPRAGAVLQADAVLQTDAVQRAEAGVQLDVPEIAEVPPIDAAPIDNSWADERRQLIELLIYAWDRARSPGVWERLAAGLAEVGVEVLRPDGEAFDPNAHEVGGTESTDDEAKVDTVAETEVVGFADRGVVLREPVVVVYRRA